MKTRWTCRHGMSAVALALISSGALGCYVTRAAPQRTPGYEAPAPQSRPFDARLVDPAFERALGAFVADLDTLQGRRGDVEDVEIRKTLRLLSIAVEKVPFSEGIDVRRGREAIRGGRPTTTRSVRRDGSHGAATEQGLEGIAATLTDLARGPYRTAPGVIGHAYACTESVRRIDAARSARGEKIAAIDAMTSAEAALLEIRGAVGRYEVTEPVRTPVARWGEP
jgi:hypothetical protein